MKTKRLSPDEQLKLIEQCRKSGMTDAEWCYENNIRVKTFYMWIYRLRKRGIVDLPASIAEPIPDQSHKMDTRPQWISSLSSDVAATVWMAGSSGNLLGSTLIISEELFA